MSGTTPLSKNLNISYGGTLNPFDYDTTGLSRNQTLQDNSRLYWAKHHKIGRLTAGNLNFGYTFSGPKAKSGTDAKPGTQSSDKDAKKPEPRKKKEDFDYFKIPWSFTFNYTLNYSKSPLKAAQVIQNLTFNGNFNLTPKWKVTFSSAYDITHKQFSYTSTRFTINRDLHCMVMSLDVSPFGNYRYYSFRIAVLSQFLSDLKYEEHKNYYDYGGYNGY
jgi:hypothetical protein